MRWWNIENSCHGISNTNNSSHRETVLLHGKVFSATLIIQVNAYRASCYKLALSPGQTNEQSWIQRSTFARYNITWPLGRPYWKVLVQHFPMLEAVGPTFSHVGRCWSNVFCSIKHWKEFAFGWTIRRITPCIGSHWKINFCVLPVARVASWWRSHRYLW